METDKKGMVNSATPAAGRRRPYERPAILEEANLDTIALGCGAGDTLEECGPPVPQS